MIEGERASRILAESSSVCCGKELAQLPPVSLARASMDETSIAHSFSWAIGCRDCPRCYPLPLPDSARTAHAPCQAAVNDDVRSLNASVPFENSSRALSWILRQGLA